jgi:antitoxin component YwqK of YwqJK toxin-antitoxin module
VVGEKESLRTRVAGLAALLLALLPGVSLGNGYSVVGACRAGVANGAYELRAADGSLRVVGAFAQGHLAGTFIFWTGGGARLAVVPFDNDARNGTVALWYAAPDAPVEAGRRLEAPYVDDRPHGIARSWHANGAPRSETRYEHGVLAAARGWTEDGVPLSAAAARELAGKDAAADAQFHATLLALVRDNLPHCD